MHTPGPWTYRRAAKHYHIEASAPGYGKAIAEVRFSANDDTGWTSEDNARLVAAPALLEALQTAVGVMRIGQLLDNSRDTWNNPISMALNAIAKATNKSG